MSKPVRESAHPSASSSPNLEQFKMAGLNTMTSKSGQCSYDRAITDSSLVLFRTARLLLIRLILYEPTAWIMSR